MIIEELYTTQYMGDSHARAVNPNQPLLLEIVQCGHCSIGLGGNLIWQLPSGKRLHNSGKSPFYKWVNQLFLNGHFQ